MATIAGKVFFLDSSSPDVLLARRVEDHGGTVDTWFHRKVDYLVTTALN